LLSGRDPSTLPSAISANFFYIIKINKILRLPTTEAVRSIQQNLSSTSAIVYIVKDLQGFTIKNRRVHPDYIWLIIGFIVEEFRLQARADPDQRQEKEKSSSSSSNRVSPSHLLLDQISRLYDEGLH
jgi:hypothetical protein